MPKPAHGWGRPFSRHGCEPATWVTTITNHCKTGPWGNLHKEFTELQTQRVGAASLQPGGYSVQFSHSVVSDSLRPHELQHIRPPCPTPTAGVHPNPCPSSRWCHPVISSSVVPFSSCLQSFPASGSFQMSQLFSSCGQSIEASASTSLLPMNTQDWSSLGGLVGSPCSPRVSQESSPTPQFKSINSSALSLLYSPTLTSIHDHWKKPWPWLDGHLLAK